MGMKTYGGNPKAENGNVGALCAEKQVVDGFGRMSCAGVGDVETVNCADVGGVERSNCAGVGDVGGEFVLVDNHEILAGLGEDFSENGLREIHLDYPNHCTNVKRLEYNDNGD
ncbi:hypothetical protein KEM48_000146 [Puccinia striiformis f. sp. tritici PST-130]|nr:hypothetical protein KEM48_000146 [Puccinia striiformis f. sp. tritici PST-130]